MIQWEQVVTEAPWCRRDSMGEVVHDGKMWIFGGYTPTRINDVWCSADGVNWAQVTPQAPWGGRNLPCALVHGGRMWLLGGFAPKDKATNRFPAYNDVWSSANGADWTLVAQAPWSARGAAGAVVFDNKMWVLGGFDGTDFSHSDEVWSSADGVAWKLEDHAPWGPRAMMACLVFGKWMWVLGGGIYDDRHPLNTVADYSDVWRSEDGASWEQVTADAGWAPRRFHCGVVYAGGGYHRMWILGGYHQGNRNDVWSSRDGRHWTEEQTPWPIRHEPGCLEFKEQLWLLGGFGDTLYNDVWRGSGS
ncbi:MAG: galactose oxidase [Candidatus Handelsmanbacteria bacterium]|nr:galactose oxidase [Candidatus Handelsmanbacteria bacterium]